MAKINVPGPVQPTNTLGGSHASRAPVYTSARLVPPLDESEADVPVSEKPKRPGLMSKPNKRRSPTEVSATATSRPSKLPRRDSSPDDVIAASGTNSAAVRKRKQRAGSPSNHPQQRFSPAKEYKARSNKQLQMDPRSNAEDELAMNGTPTKALKEGAVSRNATKTKTSPTGRNERTSKADIKPTIFESSEGRRGRDRLWLRIARAYSGNHTYIAESTDPDERIHLRKQAANVLTPEYETHSEKRNAKDEYLWLEIKFRSCRAFKLAHPASPHVVVQRTAGNTIPSDLGLEFYTPEECAAFCDWVYERRTAAETINPSSTSPTILNTSARGKQIFDRQFDLAKAREGHYSHKEALDIQYLKRQDAARAAEAHSQEGPSFSERQAHGFRRKDNMRGAPEPSSSTRVPANAVSEPSQSARRASLRNSAASTPNEREGAAKAQTTRQAPQSRPTRSTAQSTSRNSPGPLRWTTQHPDWNNIWDDRPLIYPSTGRNTAQVTQEDIPRLDEGELFNDNLIVFYLRYLQVELQQRDPQLSERIYFMNPWFYEKLSQKEGRHINYDAVKSWTAKVDLLSYDYIIVPVNEHMHWYLAIICHPAKLLDSAAENISNPAEPEPAKIATRHTARTIVVNRDTEGQQASDDHKPQVVSDEIEPRNSAPLPTPAEESADPNIKPGSIHPSHGLAPRVITFDSLGGPHSATIKNLKDYLIQEIKHKRNVDVKPPGTFGKTAKGIPEQEDLSSCGAYLCGYVEKFLGDADGVICNFFAKKDLNWDINPMTLRGNIRSLLMRLRREQNGRLAAEKEAKKLAKAQRLAEKEQGGAVTASSPSPTAQETAGTNDPIDINQVPKASNSDSLSHSGNASCFQALYEEDLEIPPTSVEPIPTSATQSSTTVDLSRIQRAKSVGIAENDGVPLKRNGPIHDDRQLLLTGDSPEPEAGAALLTLERPVREASGTSSEGEEAFVTPPERREALGVMSSLQNPPVLTGHETPKIMSSLKSSPASAALTSRSTRLQARRTNGMQTGQDPTAATKATSAPAMPIVRSHFFDKWHRSGDPGQNQSSSSNIERAGESGGFPIPKTPGKAIEISKHLTPADGPRYGGTIRRGEEAEARSQLPGRQKVIQPLTDISLPATSCDPMEIDLTED